jgi:ElaB/YqjD/DUF883 family membrane-anchored ribosome-binding protein
MSSPADPEQLVAEAAAAEAEKEEKEEDDDSPTQPMEEGKNKRERSKEGDASIVKETADPPKRSRTLSDRVCPQDAPFEAFKCPEEDQHADDSADEEEEEKELPHTVPNKDDECKRKDKLICDLRDLVKRLSHNTKLVQAHKDRAIELKERADAELHAAWAKMETMQEELDRAHRECLFATCRNCCERPACVLSEPCGHMGLCEICAPLLSWRCRFCEREVISFRKVVLPPI